MEGIGENEKVMVVFLEDIGGRDSSDDSGGGKELVVSVVVPMGRTRTTWS